MDQSVYKSVTDSVLFEEHFCLSIRWLCLLSVNSPARLQWTVYFIDTVLLNFVFLNIFCCVLKVNSGVGIVSFGGSVNLTIFKTSPLIYFHLP